MSESHKIEKLERTITRLIKRVEDLEDIVIGLGLERGEQ
jgi:hypothetical protein